MIVNFAKMHGLGNDFVVIDLITQGARLNKNHFAKIADRRLGIGCDQIILVTPPTQEGADFSYKIHNADGNEVEQCGNGLRCAARFFNDMGLTNKTKMIADCLGGRATITIDSPKDVTVQWDIGSTDIKLEKLDYTDMPKEIHTLSFGNPHGVCVLDTIDNHKVKVWGRKISRAPIFPNGANIGFMQVLARDKIKLRVFERGSGLTPACGSAACAAVLVGRHLNLLDNQVNVLFKNGELVIKIDDEKNTLSMSGPTSHIYVGRFRI